MAMKMTQIMEPCDLCTGDVLGSADVRTYIHTYIHIHTHTLCVCVCVCVCATDTRVLYTSDV